MQLSLEGGVAADFFDWVEFFTKEVAEAVWVLRRNFLEWVRVLGQCRHRVLRNVWLG